MNKIETPLCLLDKPRIVVSGATGWLGRSLVNLLIRNFGVDSSQMLLLASRETQINIDGRVLPVHAMKIDLVKSFAPNVFFHLACVTQDKLRAISKEIFLEENYRIFEFAIDVISLKSIEFVMTTSSGAAVRFVRGSGSKDLDPYGFFKNFEENHYQNISDRNILIMRPWSLTGGHINKLSEYAISDMISQAEETKSIIVRAPNMVLRRYAGAEQFLQVAIAMMGIQDKLVLDSGGPLTDLVHLAHVVSRVLKTNSRIVFEVNDELQSDDYFSTSYLYESLLQEMNMIPMTIEQQVAETIRGMKKRGAL